MSRRNVRNFKITWRFFFSSSLLVIIMIAAAWAAGAAAQAGDSGGSPPAASDAPAQTRPEHPDDDASPKRTKLDVTFEPSSLFFGTLAPNQPASDVVTITNHGESPVRIAAVRGSCKCTTAEVDSKTIDPGRHVVMRVTMHGRESIGSKSSVVYVQLEGEANPRMLRARYDIARTVHPTPTRLDAKNVLEGIFAVEASDGRPFRVLSSNGEAPQFVGFDPDHDSPRSSYVLKWNLMDVKCEEVRDWWIVETDHPDAPVVEMRIMNNCTQREPEGTREWALSPSLAIVAKAKADEWEEMTFSIEKPEDNAPPAIDRVISVQGPQQKGRQEIQAELLPSDDPMKVHVRVKAPPSQKLTYATLRLFSGKESMPVNVVIRLADPDRISQASDR